MNTRVKTAALFIWRLIWAIPAVLAYLLLVASVAAAHGADAADDLMNRISDY